MKTFKIISFIVLVCIAKLVSAHDTIYVSHNKTTAIQFPARIADQVNVGHHLITSVNDENVLTVKASEGFSSSEIRITTVQGEVFKFSVTFSYGRAGRFYRLSDNLETKQAAEPKSPGEDVSSPIASGRIKNVMDRDRKSRIKAQLGQISVSGNTLFYKLKIENSSNINYDIDFVRFYVRDLKTAKRTVVQEREMNPSHAFGISQNMVKAGDSGVFVFAFNKFPLARDQALYLEIYEKNGARHLYLRVKEKENLKAQLIKQ